MDNKRKNKKSDHEENIFYKKKYEKECIEYNKEIRENSERVKFFSLKV